VRLGATYAAYLKAHWKAPIHNHFLFTDHTVDEYNNESIKGKKTYTHNSPAVPTYCIDVAIVITQKYLLELEFLLVIIELFR